VSDLASAIGTSFVQSLDELDELYDRAVPTSISKVTDHVTALQRKYIEASPFVLIATTGVDGVDCSPRGDDPGFVRVHDERTLLMPDRRGNNRLDTLRNIVVDPHVGLLFLVPGIGVTLRVNGTARLSTDQRLREEFEFAGKVPTTVIVITAEAVYTQCPKALIRSKLWDPSLHRDASELPTVGQIMEDISAGAFDGRAYDEAYPERVRTTLY